MVFKSWNIFRLKVVICTDHLGLPQGTGMDQLIFWRILRALFPFSLPMSLNRKLPISDLLIYSFPLEFELQCLLLLLSQQGYVIVSTMTEFIELQEI